MGSLPFANGSYTFLAKIEALRVGSAVEPLLHSSLCIWQLKSTEPSPPRLIVFSPMRHTLDGLEVAPSW